MLQPKRLFIGIDPGIHKLGLCVGLEGATPECLTFDPTKGRKPLVSRKLEGSALSRAVANAAWEGPLRAAFDAGRRPQNVVVVHEIMQEDGRTSGKADNLFALTLTLGCLVAGAPEGAVTWGIAPRTWKSNFPKPVIHARLANTWGELIPDFDKLGHDALDALGIWAFGVAQFGLRERIGQLPALLEANQWDPR